MRQAEQAGTHGGGHAGAIDEVGFLEDRNTIPAGGAEVELELLLTEEAKIDMMARQKIANQRKIIQEVARRSGTFCIASTTTMKCESWGFEEAFLLSWRRWGDAGSSLSGRIFAKVKE